MIMTIAETVFDDETLTNIFEKIPYLHFKANQATVCCYYLS